MNVKVTRTLIVNATKCHLLYEVWEPFRDHVSIREDLDGTSRWGLVGTDRSEDFEAAKLHVAELIGRVYPEVIGRLRQQGVRFWGDLEDDRGLANVQRLLDTWRELEARAAEARATLETRAGMVVTDVSP